MDLSLQTVDDFLTKREYADITKKNYKYWVKKLIQHYGNDDLNDYKELDILNFLNHMKKIKKNGHNSIRIAISAMNFVFNILGKLEYDFSSVQKGKVINKEKKTFSQETIIEILEICEKTKYKIAFSLLYGTGITTTELLNIKVKDIDLINEIIIINSSKRQAKIPQRLLVSIKNFIQNAKLDDWLFQGSNNNKNDISSFRKKLKELSRQLNHRPEIQLKDLRTAYIKHLEDMNVPIHSILDELGMSKSPFARTYSINHYARIRNNDKSVDYSPLDKKIINSDSNFQTKSSYIDLNKIDKIKKIKNERYDFSKAIEILNQINLAHEQSMFFTIGMLVRALIDHIPPLFECNNFNEVSNNYKGSTSFKKLMKKLQDSLRNISDSFLHDQIRKREELPSFNQVNFIPEVDALLSELIRINKKTR